MTPRMPILLLPAAAAAAAAALLSMPSAARSQHRDYLPYRDSPRAESRSEPTESRVQRLWGGFLSCDFLTFLFKEPIHRAKGDTP